MSRREDLAAITITTPLQIKEVEESYMGDELVPRLIFECVIGGKNSDEIEYKNGLIYKDGRIYIDASNNVRQKIINEIHASQQGDIHAYKQVIIGQSCTFGLG